jgi:hypothetical protein
MVDNCSCAGNELKSQLYRNFGKLYASQGRLEAALKQLANDVYYSSLESGPEHIDTAGDHHIERKLPVLTSLLLLTWQVVTSTWQTCS